MVDIRDTNIDIGINESCSNVNSRVNNLNDKQHRIKDTINLIYSYFYLKINKFSLLSKLSLFIYWLLLKISLNSIFKISQGRCRMATSVSN